MKEVIEFKDDSLYLLNQRTLPRSEETVKIDHYKMVAGAIKNMTVRGAPAIGITAAYGYCLGVKEFLRKNTEKNCKNSTPEFLKNVKSLLLNSRPTAVNLKWAVNRMEQKYRELRLEDADKIYFEIVKEAHKIKETEIEANIAIGEYGADILEKLSSKKEKGLNLLTHCNAGALATGGWGTALGVVRSAQKRKLINKVFVDETRPRLQGAKLTCYELEKENIPYRLIVDSMAGFLMKRGRIDAVVVGADRIAASGDVANKIGTYTCAILAYRHKVPFYVAAPISTFDFETESGSDIEIERRSSKEVLFINGRGIAPVNTEAENYAFDVTDNNLVEFYITEKGVINQIYELR